MLFDGHRVKVVAVALLALVLSAACSGGERSRARVAITTPADGATVVSPFQVAMEAESFGIEPAGAVRAGAGHFHLMVDSACVTPGEPIPHDEAHRHLDDGSATIVLALPAGEHTLCLQAGDGAHTALELTDEARIEVTAPIGAGPTSTPAVAAGAELWRGTYRGSVEWDCGPLGRRGGTLAGDFTIEVDEDAAATLTGLHTVTGSCAGPEVGTLSTPVTVTGSRTAAGIELPSTLWGPPGSFTIAVSGDRGAGTLTGPAPGPATIDLAFAIERDARPPGAP